VAWARQKLQAPSGRIAKSGQGFFTTDENGWGKGAGRNVLLGLGFAVWIVVPVQFPKIRV
jgi:hypothetical protein